jgi:hypothetical protein
LNQSVSDLKEMMNNVKKLKNVLKINIESDGRLEKLSTFGGRKLLNVKSY